jgi:hypothetical protein
MDIVNSFIETQWNTCVWGVTTHTFIEHELFHVFREIPGNFDKILFSVEEIISTHRYTWRSCEELLQNVDRRDITHETYERFPRKSYKFKEIYTHKVLSQGKDMLRPVACSALNSIDDGTQELFLSENTCELVYKKI